MRRRPPYEQHRSSAAFVNALRETLGLDPLVPEAAQAGRVFHQAWPWRSGNYQVRRTKTDTGEGGRS